ncbi:MAG TPA: putative DNA-binding domain-containing protein [Pseudomonadales bacterium]
MLDLQQQQALLAGHIRNPQCNPAPAGIDERRLVIYRELFFNNIEGFIASGFPVFKSLFDGAEWQALVRRFIADYRAQTPYFLQISEAFLQWLNEAPQPLLANRPFAWQLCHYEWVELALDVADVALPAVAANGDLLRQSPLVSPLAWPLVYQWPVHHIGRNYQPQTPSAQPVCLIVYRNRQQQVAFIESSPATVRLLQLLDERPDFSGEQALWQIAAELPGSDPAAVLAYGEQQLQQLHSQGVILGVRLP